MQRGGSLRSEHRTPVDENDVLDGQSYVPCPVGPVNHMISDLFRDGPRREGTKVLRDPYTYT